MKRVSFILAFFVLILSFNVWASNASSKLVVANKENKNLSIGFGANSSYGGSQSICDVKKCPFIISNGLNKASVTCDKKTLSCNVIYENASGMKKSLSSDTYIFIDKYSKIRWISKNVLEIAPSFYKGFWSSFFIDFKNMRLTHIESPYAVNKDKLVVAYQAQSDDAIIVSPIFDQSRKIIITGKPQEKNLDIDLTISDLYFDKNGNLVIPYCYSHNNAGTCKQTTQIIPIDYKKLGID